MPVREPKTPEQKKAMLDLLKWATDRMDVTPAEVEKALLGAKQDNWRAALELLSTYYFMNNIKKPKGKNPFTASSGASAW